MEREKNAAMRVVCLSALFILGAHSAFRYTYEIYRHNFNYSGRIDILSKLGLPLPIMEDQGAHFFSSSDWSYFACLWALSI